MTSKQVFLSTQTIEKLEEIKDSGETIDDVILRMLLCTKIGKTKFDFERYIKYEENSRPLQAHLDNIQISGYYFNK